MFIMNIVYLILSTIVLIVSATLLVKVLYKISSFLRISEFTAAFIIMAFATSVPELFVGISSAISKVPSLSLGNVLGSSILHLTLLMGIFVLLGNGIKVKGAKIKEDVYYVLISVILLIVLFLINSSLSRVDGIILITFFLFNSYRMFRKRKKYKAKFNEKRIKRFEIVLDVVIFMVALFALFISANYTVKHASLLAIELKLPNIMIGIFLLSFATTLPELAFGFEAIKLGHKDMALGDLTGGVLTNFGLIIGLVALISPVKAELSSFLMPAIFLFVSTLVFITFLKSGKELKIPEGVALILLYVFFVIAELFIIAQ